MWWYLDRSMTHHKWSSIGTVCCFFGDLKTLSIRKEIKYCWRALGGEEEWKFSLRNLRLQKRLGKKKEFQNELCPIFSVYIIEQGFRVTKQKIEYPLVTSRKSEAKERKGARQVGGLSSGEKFQEESLWNAKSNTDEQGADFLFYLFIFVIAKC